MLNHSPPAAIRAVDQCTDSKDRAHLSAIDHSCRRSSNHSSGVRSQPTTSPRSGHNRLVRAAQGASDAERHRPCRTPGGSCSPSQSTSKRRLSRYRSSVRLQLREPFETSQACDHSTHRSKGLPARIAKAHSVQGVRLSKRERLVADQLSCAFRVFMWREVPRRRRLPRRGGSPKPRGGDYASHQSVHGP